MNTLLTFIATLSLAFAVISQDCSSLNMIQKGSKWELTNYNKKDKVQSSTVYHVTDLTSTGDAVIWNISVEMKDDDGEIYNSTESEISCEAGVFKMSMEQFMNNEQFQGMQEMDVEINASDIEYPTVPKVGETLPDASTNGMTVMNITTKIKDRKIESKEEIETPAGSFDCLVISQTTVIANQLLSKDFKSKDWYVPGFGVVRSESYKSNGKLIGYSLLTKYEL